MEHLAVCHYFANAGRVAPGMGQWPQELEYCKEGHFLFDGRSAASFGTRWVSFLLACAGSAFSGQVASSWRFLQTARQTAHLSDGLASKLYWERLVVQALACIARWLM